MLLHELVEGLGHLAKSRAGRRVREARRRGRVPPGEFLRREPATRRIALELGLRFGSGDETGKESSDIVKLTVDGREITIAVLVTPGVADFTILVPMGYGRTFGGRVATDKVGFNTHPLRSTMTTGFLAGATVAKSGGTYLLALTQDHSKMRGDSEAADRPILRHAEIEEFTGTGPDGARGARVALGQVGR